MQKPIIIIFGSLFFLGRRGTDASEILTDLLANLNEEDSDDDASQNLMARIGELSVDDGEDLFDYIQANPLKGTDEAVWHLQSIDNEMWEDDKFEKTRSILESIEKCFRKIASDSSGATRRLRHYDWLAAAATPASPDEIAAGLALLVAEVDPRQVPSDNTLKVAASLSGIFLKLAKVLMESDDGSLSGVKLTELHEKVTKNLLSQAIALYVLVNSTNKAEVKMFLRTAFQVDGSKMLSVSSVSDKSISEIYNQMSLYREGKNLSPHDPIDLADFLKEEALSDFWGFIDGLKTNAGTETDEKTQELVLQKLHALNPIMERQRESIDFFEDREESGKRLEKAESAQKTAKNIKTSIALGNLRNIFTAFSSEEYKHLLYFNGLGLVALGSDTEEIKDAISLITRSEDPSNLPEASALELCTPLLGHIAQLGLVCIDNESSDACGILADAISTNSVTQVIGLFVLRNSLDWTGRADEAALVVGNAFSSPEVSVMKMEDLKHVEPRELLQEMIEFKLEEGNTTPFSLVSFLDTLPLACARMVTEFSENKSAEKFNKGLDELSEHEALTLLDFKRRRSENSSLFNDRLGTAIEHASGVKEKLAGLDAEARKLLDTPRSSVKLPSNLIAAQALEDQRAKLVRRAQECVGGKPLLCDSLSALVFKNTYTEALSLHLLAGEENGEALVKSAFDISQAVKLEGLEFVKHIQVSVLFEAIKAVMNTWSWDNKMSGNNLVEFLKELPSAFIGLLSQALRAGVSESALLGKISILSRRESLKVFEFLKKYPEPSIIAQMAKNGMGSLIKATLDRIAVALGKRRTFPNIERYNLLAIAKYDSEKVELVVDKLLKEDPSVSSLDNEEYVAVVGDMYANFANRLEECRENSVDCRGIQEAVFLNTFTEAFVLKLLSTPDDRMARLAFEVSQREELEDFDRLEDLDLKRIYMAMQWFKKSSWFYAKADGEGVYAGALDLAPFLSRSPIAFYVSIADIDENEIERVGETVQDDLSLKQATKVFDFVTSSNAKEALTQLGKSTANSAVIQSLDFLVSNAKNLPTDRTGLFYADLMGKLKKYGALKLLMRQKLARAHVDTAVKMLESGKIKIPTESNGDVSLAQDILTGYIQLSLADGCMADGCGDLKSAVFVNPLTIAIALVHCATEIPQEKLEPLSVAIFQNPSVIEYFMDGQNKDILKVANEIIGSKKNGREAVFSILKDRRKKSFWEFISNERNTADSIVKFLLGVGENHRELIPDYFGGLIDGKKVRDRLIELSGQNTNEGVASILKELANLTSLDVRKRTDLVLFDGLGSIAFGFTVQEIEKAMKSLDGEQVDEKSISQDDADLAVNMMGFFDYFVWKCFAGRAEACEKISEELSKSDYRKAVCLYKLVHHPMWEEDAVKANRVVAEAFGFSEQVVIDIDSLTEESVSDFNDVIHKFNQIEMGDSNRDLFFTEFQCMKAAQSLERLSEPRELIAWSKAKQANDRLMNDQCAVKQDRWDTREKFIDQLGKIVDDSLFPAALSYLEALPKDSSKAIVKAGDFRKALQAIDEGELAKYLVKNGPSWDAEDDEVYPQFIVIFTRLSKDKKATEILHAVTDLVEMEARKCIPFNAKNENCQDFRDKVKCNFIMFVALAKKHDAAYVQTVFHEQTVMGKVMSFVAGSETIPPDLTGVDEQKLLEYFFINANEKSPYDTWKSITSDIAATMAPGGSS